MVQLQVQKKFNDMEWTNQLQKTAGGGDINIGSAKRNILVIMEKNTGVMELI
ncbi:hypothetical protein ACVBEG_26710 [Pseudomonas sp. GG8]